LPLIDFDIEHIGRELGKIGVPWNLMYSCYWFPPCSYRSENDKYLCPGCRRKKIAMKAAGVDTDYPNLTKRTYQSLDAEETGY